MILGKPSAAVRFNCSPILSRCVPAAITSPWSPRGHPAAPRHLRAYASVHHEASKGHAHAHWPVSPYPTPYEIFDQSKTAPYSKGRFYELVKQYHPDRHHQTSHDGIPHQTKLERYRLIVAANNILSDPERRRLYDRYGTGWEGETANIRTRCRAADKAWRQQPGNASMNATWEDWERWHDRREGKKQEPLYMSNAGVVGIIALFALIGGYGHVSRAGTHSATLLDMRDHQQASISKIMQERQSQMAGLDKRGRVEVFLKQREGWGYDLPGHGQLPVDSGK